MTTESESPKEKKPLIFRTAFKQENNGDYHFTVTDADLHIKNPLSVPAKPTE